MELKIDRESKQPLYVQIHLEIAKKIRSGEYPMGSQLLSERELAKELNVNRSTIIRVYEELLVNNLIERKKGIGTFVAQNISPLLLNTNWNQYVRSGTLLPTNKKILDVRHKSINESLYDFSHIDISSDLCPTEEMKEALYTYDGPIETKSTDPKGMLELREQLVLHVKKYYDIETSPSSIMITSGSQQAIYLIIQSLLQEGDSIALESPSYLESQHFIKSAKINTYYLKMDKEGIIPEDIEELHKKHRIKMLFLNPTYQNPTGFSYSVKRRKEIVQITEKLGIPIVEGDPFSLINLEGEIWKPLKYYDKTGNILYIGSFSKVLGSNLRIGWILGPPLVIQRLADAKYQIDFGISVYSQLICSEFIKKAEFDMHLRSLKKKLLERRNTLISGLDMYFDQDFIYSIPSGGLHLFGYFKNKSVPIANIERPYFSVTLGNLYGAPDNYVRWSFSKLSNTEIKKGIKIISEGIYGDSLDSTDGA